MITMFLFILSCMIFSIVFVVLMMVYSVFFFFQAEDGIRDRTVTGVQTCALPIYKKFLRKIFAFIARRVHSQEDAEDLTQEFFVKVLKGNLLRRADPERGRFRSLLQIGRASCRERV